MVDFKVEFYGKSVVVPISLQAAKHAGSESCLLRTNIGPMGLTCPAAGVKTKLMKGIVGRFPR